MDTSGRTLIRRRLNAGRFRDARLERPDADDPAAADGAAADPRATVANPADLDHQPVRPLWICGVCEQPWPCPAACRHLSATMNSAQLGLFMVACLHQATADGLDEVPAQLYRRFLSWIRGAR